jgi:hypothetical protein
MKIHRDSRKSRYTTGINNTCGKFATGVSYTSGKFATGINENSGELSHWYHSGVVDTDGRFAEVGGPQIANPQICGLTKFVTLGPSANVAICRFAICAPYICAICGLKTLQIRSCSNQIFIKLKI